MEAVGTRMHRGRTTWVWDVVFADSQERICALTRMTIAVRPAPDGHVLVRDRFGSEG